MKKIYSTLLLSTLASAALSATDFDSKTDSKWHYRTPFYTSQGGILLSDKVSESDLPSELKIDRSILTALTNSLPESRKNDITHPEYFPTNEPEIVVTKDDTEVFVTFYSEGAGYKNALGYYAYEGNTSRLKPTFNGTTQWEEWEAEIKKNGVLIFPNTSLLGSGGDLVPYTTVSLGKFSEGTKFIFFLISNGWNTNKVTPRKYSSFKDWIYSTYSPLNQESNSTKPASSTIAHNRHVALLWKNISEEGNILLMGFEDILRTFGSCDHDFNDAFFSVSSKPLASLSDTVKESGNKGGFSGVPGEKDSDEDGINDAFDSYPNDSERVSDSYYPSRDGKATLAYEDLWPYEGDYDMNDVTISFNIKETKDAQHKVKALVMTGNTQSYGASYYDGFSIALDTPYANIEPSDVNITGSLTKNYTAEVKEDPDTKNAVIEVLSNQKQWESEIKKLFSEKYTVTTDDHNNTYYNVYKNRTYTDKKNGDTNITYAKSDTFTLTVVLKNSAKLMAPPYNPFITVAGYLKETNYKEYTNDQREIHLPNFAPTSINQEKWFTLFNTKDDDSNLTTKRYYKTKTNKPWGLLIPTNFNHPIETVDVKNAYRHYLDWAESNGTKYADWYIWDKKDDTNATYADETKIIKH